MQDIGYVTPVKWLFNPIGPNCPYQHPLSPRMAQVPALASSLNAKVLVILKKRKLIKHPSLYINQYEVSDGKCSASLSSNT